MRNKNIVCIGGGTGLFSLLSGLKNRVYDENVIKAIVATTDNGGSSGNLQTQYGILPPGDIRNCIIALSEEPEITLKLHQHRFDKNLGDHNLGNLNLLALTEIFNGDFGKAVQHYGRMHRAKGEVIPVSLEDHTLCARFTDGTYIEGESQITKAGKKIDKVFLKREGKGNSRALQAILNADIIVFGPGSLYTSIIPNLLYDNLRKVIDNNYFGKKVLISNVMSESGETTGYKVSDIKRNLERYLKTGITHLIANTHVPPQSVLNKYLVEENKSPIYLDEHRILGCEIISGNFIDEHEFVRHCPEKIADPIVKLV